MVTVDTQTQKLVPVKTYSVAFAGRTTAGIGNIGQVVHTYVPAG